MRVRRKEGVTDHLHPESCAGRREAAGEALTGARTGGLLSIERRQVWSAETVTAVEGHTDITATGEGMEGSTVSENPRTFVHPSPGPGRSSFRPGSRTGAAEGRRIPYPMYPMVHGMKKSDEARVPMKVANKGAKAPAEPLEGRASTKGNSRDQST